MTRSPDHTSGPKEAISVSLTPEQLRILNDACQREGRNRSDFLGRLIVRLAGNPVDEVKIDDDIRPHNPPSGTTVHIHTKARVGTHGRPVCTCGAIEGTDLVWREP